MSVKIRHLVKEYHGKWKIDKWLNLPNKGACYATPVITPISSENLRLFFELKWDFFRSMFDSGPLTSCLELRIFRQSKFGGNYLEMDANFSIYYPDGKLLRECKNPFSINIRNLFNVCFDRTRFERQNASGTEPLFFTDHCQKLGNNSFTLKCNLKFYIYLTPIDSNVTLTNLQKFTRKFSCMYENNILTDFEFKVGGKSLYAHKALLSVHSSVFAAMVSGDFRESKTNTAVITDCSYETFDSFLRYLYSGDIIFPSWNYLLELYLLADKYDVSTLKEQCSDQLIKTMTVDRISKTLRIANSCRDSRLLKATKKFCAKLPDTPE